MSLTIGNPAHIESILQKYGFEKIRRNSNGFMALCKFHEDRKNPSFSINNSGLWMCWTCKAKGNLRGLIKALGGDDADWKSSLQILGMQLESSPYSIVEEKKPKREKAYGLPVDFKPFKGDNIPEYLMGRLSKEAVFHFGLGSSNMYMNKGRIIIPVIMDGKVIGYHGRSISKGTVPKYYNAKGFEIKDYLFNYDGPEKGGEVICVEGAFNAMSMWEKGFPNVVATFGTQFRPAQIKRLLSLNPSSIVICFDRDSSPARPGQQAARKLGEILSAVVPTYIMPLPMDKDPNELPAKVLELCYQKRVAYEKVFK